MMRLATIGILTVAFLLTSPVEAQRKSSAGRPSNGKKTPPSKVPKGSGRVDWGPVAKVSPGRLEAVKAKAKKIDQLLEAGYRKHNVTPNRGLTDTLFLRRAYLEIGGRIPTLEEISRFKKSKNRNKREKLIDDLLGSTEHVSHMFNYWADLLRLKDNPINNNQIAQPYHEYIKDNIRTNKPYDKWVREMMTAEGRIWDNPAVGFVMRDSNMELDAVDNMVQVFLGTQIGCAQCHDHPFDRWTQKEYYEMAAFWYPVRTRASVGDKKKFTNGNPLQRVRAEMKKIDPEANTNGQFARMVNANLFEVWDQKNRPLKLPHDYQYDNAKPNQRVQMKPIFGTNVKVTATDRPRDVLAKWMTSPENPRFAKNVANRLWKKAFGVGLIEPVDDIQDTSDCSNPELLDLLSQTLVQNDFDLRELQRIIFNTRAWQREASFEDIDLSQPYYFPGPILRRMTSEQIWDSLLTVAVYHPESFTRPSLKSIGGLLDMDLNAVSAQDVQRISEEFQEKYSRNAERKLTRERNYYKGMVLARASELPSPLPPEHFLRQFGQSDRELIQSSGRDGSVSQILTMFNGEITHMMLERGSLIFDTIVQAQTLEARTDVIFYSILSRAPSSGERRVAEKEIRATGVQGFGHVTWALINTKEFLFIQ